MLGSNPNTVVSNTNDDRAILLTRRDLNLALLLSEFDRVRNQILHHQRKMGTVSIVRFASGLEV